MFGRRKVAVIVAEFLGTAVLTLLILSVQRSTIGVPFFVAIAAGLTFALMTFALVKTSGALFNPALTIAMWTARKISTVNAFLFIAVQMLGGYVAYSLYTYFVNQPLQQVGGEFSGRILAAEAVGAGIFAFGIAAIIYQRFTAAAASAVAGLALIVGMVAASPAAIGLLNPAVALGAKAFVLGTYVLGPIIGAIIGFNLYALLFADRDGVVASEALATGTTAAAATTAPAATVTTKRATKKPVAKTTAKATSTAKKAATKTKAVAKKPAAKRKTTAKKK